MTQTKDINQTQEPLITQESRSKKHTVSILEEIHTEDIHTEDIQDIVGTPPNALLRWGITWVLIVLLGIIALTWFIRYPDIVQTPVRINASNAPKAVITRVSGNIATILVEENDSVLEGQSLAWMESTADHSQVLELLEKVYSMRDEQLEEMNSTSSIDAPKRLRLGELQGNYQAFYQSYLSFQGATNDGIYLKRRDYIHRDIDNVAQQRKQLERQVELQKREYSLAEEEFKRYELLAEKRVISPSEYQKQQAELFAKQHPLQQTYSALLANESNHMTKIKELTDLDNQISEEKSKFIQALNSLISEVEIWKRQYVLTAQQSGTIVYTSLIQPNQYIQAGEEVFRIDPGSTNFFGEVKVPQYNMGKIREGQEVLVKLDGYPFEEYGVLEGIIGKMTGVPYQDSIFLSKVDLKPVGLQSHIVLTTGMVGMAEIITEDASLLQRLLRNMRLILDRR